MILHAWSVRFTDHKYRELLERRRENNREGVTGGGWHVAGGYITEASLRITRSPTMRPHENPLYTRPFHTRWSSDFICSANG